MVSALISTGDMGGTDGPEVMMMAESMAESTAMRSAGAPPPPPRAAKMSMGRSSFVGSEFMEDLGNNMNSGSSMDVEKMLQMEGRISIEVPFGKFDEVVGTAKSVVEETGGYLESSETYTNPVWDRQGKKTEHSIRTLSMRAFVPSKSFEDSFRAFTNIKGSTVSSSSRQSTDVTSRYIDSVSRINVLSATEAALTKLMESATTTRDVLDVQRELRNVINERESQESTKKYLEKTTANSKINIDISETPPGTDTEEVKGWSLIDAFRRAFVSLKGGAIICVESLVFAIVWGMPLTLVFGAIQYIRRAKF